MAFALPVFKIDKLAMVIPTFSASSFDCILRLASITSRFTIIAISNGKFLLFFQFQTMVKSLCHNKHNQADNKRIAK